MEKEKNKNKNKNISDTDNYRKRFNNMDNMVFEYVKILHEYLLHITLHMKIKEKTLYFYFEAWLRLIEKFIFNIDLLYK